MHKQRDVQKAINELIEVLLAGDEIFISWEEDENKQLELESARDQRTAVKVLRWVLERDIRAAGEPDAN